MDEVRSLQIKIRILEIELAVQRKRASGFRRLLLPDRRTAPAMEIEDHVSEAMMEHDLGRLKTLNQVLVIELETQTMQTMALRRLLTNNERGDAVEGRGSVGIEIDGSQSEATVRGPTFVSIPADRFCSPRRGPNRRAQASSSLCETPPGMVSSESTGSHGRCLQSHTFSFLPPYPQALGVPKDKGSHFSRESPLRANSAQALARVYWTSKRR